MARKIRTFCEIRRLCVVMTGNWLWLLCRFVSRTCRLNLASEEEISYTETTNVFIMRIMLHFKTQLCGSTLRGNVGESGKCRVGSTSGRCCENDLTWSGVKLKKIGNNCLSLQHGGGSEHYLQNFTFRLEGMRVRRWLKHRWEGNVKMDFIEMKYEAVAYSHV
jgi:hypothetical protein